MSLIFSSFIEEKKINWSLHAALIDFRLMRLKF